MNQLRKLVKNVGKLIPAVALMLGTTTATQACMWWFYQPRIPAKMLKK